MDQSVAADMNNIDPHNLWRDCVQWLVNCTILDRHHRVTWPESEVKEFAKILRDGVLLCQLANRLVRACIDQREVQLRPQLSQFLCLKNICLFLGACQKTFNIQQKDLFEAWELYNVTDFGKVLLTLSKLSRSDAAQRTGIKGFPLYAISTPAEYYNDEIYRNLEDEAGSRELEENIYEADDDDDEQTYGAIYDSLIIGTTRRGTAAPRKEPIKHDDWADFVPVDKRGHCIKELQDTELNYVEALKMILSKFYSPLKEVLTDEDHQVIFMNILELSQIHTAFYAELRRAVRLSVGLSNASDIPSNSMKIGDVFVRWKLKFVAYARYCAELPASRALIEQFSKDNAHVRQKLNECGFEANRNQFRLQDLLSVPMQRVLKYHILLNEMIKLTSIDHDDRLSLEAAKDAMVDINNYINEVKRDWETQQIIRDIQNSIVDLDMPENTNLIDYGHLIKDGELRIADHNPKDGGKVKNRYVFVFDKVMLICKNLRGNQYEYKCARILGEYKVELGEMENNNRFGTIGRKWTFVWTLVPIKDETALQMYAKSNDQKISWIQAFETANDNTKPRAAESTGHTLHYHTYSDAVECSHCEKLLAGSFYQGYRCDVCRVNLHKRCIEMAGKCRGRPATKRPTTDFQPPIQPSRNSIITKGEWVVAVKSFRAIATIPDCLSFEEGETIEVIDVGSDGWWKGRVVDDPSRVGRFKAEYVRKMRNSIVTTPFGRPVRPPLMDQSSTTPMNTTPTPITSIGRSASITSSTSEHSPLPVTPPDNNNTRSSRSTDQIGVNASSASAAIANYVNTELIKQSWYMGNIDRNEAQNKLQGMPDGTFLVRYSANQDRYALSISYEREVKHVRVESTPQGLYLDESCIFPDLIELINYYHDHNLQESFTALNTTLQSSYRDIVRVVRAMHNFDATDDKMLSLRKDDIVFVIDTNGEERGWWKGRVNGRVGYFPFSYVSRDIDPAELETIILPTT